MTSEGILGQGNQAFSGVAAMPTDQDAIPALRGAGTFATTHWSVVLAAGQPFSAESQQALATLCTTYWYPLYAYARRRLDTVHEAQDLTQEFFARLLEKDLVGHADPSRGRFRSFLLTCFKNFLSKQQAQANAEKRGGGRPVLPLDFEAGERKYSREPFHQFTPERIYERRWALTLLDQVFVRLRREFAEEGKSSIFDALKVYLAGEKPSEQYADIAARLDMTQGAIKMAIHRLRQRYRELLRAEIAQTLDTPEEIDDEIRQLFAAVRSEK
jgi:RNA polymerase sigma-70 factor (ECF subfamily)